MMKILLLLCFILFKAPARDEASASDRNEFEVFDNSKQDVPDQFKQVSGIESSSKTCGCLIVMSRKFCLKIASGNATIGSTTLMKIRSHGLVTGRADVAGWSNTSETGWSNVADWSNALVEGWSNAPVTGLTNVVSPHLTEIFADKSQQTLTPEYANSGTFEDWTLWNLLTHIASTALKDCFITMIYGEEFKDSSVLQDLLRLPNLKQAIEVLFAKLMDPGPIPDPSYQRLFSKNLHADWCNNNLEKVVKVSGVADFKNMRWEDVASCRGYIMMQSQRELLLEVTNAGDYDWDYKGRFVLVGFDSEQLQDLLKSKKFYNTQDTIGIIKDHRVGEWSLYTNWRVFKGDMTLIGSWKIDRFTSPETVIFPDKVNDLHGAPVKHGTFEYKPIVMYVRHPNGTVRERYGIDITAAKEAVEALNGTIIYEEISMKERWSGLINKIINAEVDTGACNLYIRTQGFRLHRYIFPHSHSVSRVLMRKPRPRPGWERVIYPFHFSTWISVICGIILTGPLLCLFARAGQYTGGEKRDMMSLGFAYLYTAGILFMEGQAILPTRKSLQLFVGFLWIYAMIITTGYCSNLTALLTVSKIPGTIDTFQELHDSQMDLYSNGVMTYIVALRGTGNPYMEALIERLHAYDDTVPDKVLDGSSVVLGNEQTLLYTLEAIYSFKGINIARIMKETFTSYNVAVGVPNSSPLWHKLDKVMMRIVEGGFPKLWFKNALRRVIKEQTRNTEKTQFQKRLQETVSHSLDEGAVKALGVDHVQGFFFILLAGCLAAAFAFLVEVLQGRRRQ